MNKVFENKGDRNDFYISLVVLILFASGYLLFAYPKISQQSTTAQTDVERIAEQNPIVLVSDKPADNTKQHGKQQKASVIDLVRKKKQRNTKPALSINTKTAEEKAKYLSRKTKSELSDFAQKKEAHKPSKSASPKLSESEIKEESIKEAVAEEIIEVKEEQKEVVSKVVDLKPIETEPVKKIEAKIELDKKVIKSDCVLIVGAFEMNGNADKLSDKLSQKGYTTETGRLASGLEFVGIPVNCNDTAEKNNIKARIKTDFDIDTWVHRK